jgi:NAD(P)H-nitrite reductase large subunit
MLFFIVVEYIIRKAILFTEEFMPEDKKVCKCRSVYYSEIETAVKEGAINIEDVMNRTGVATCCGGCFSQVKKILLNLNTSKRAL